jgi:hydroxylamine reductase
VSTSTPTERCCPPTVRYARTLLPSSNLPPSASNPCLSSQPCLSPLDLCPISPLPLAGYPGLKKFKHLKGHYGGAWYRQKMDFSYFPGSILVTTVRGASETLSPEFLAFPHMHACIRSLPSHSTHSLLLSLAQNCVLEPMTMYKKNIFTTNETGLANIPHLGNKDFSALVDRALALPGFDQKSCDK